MFYRFLIIIYKRKSESKTNYAWTVYTRYPLSSTHDEVQKFISLLLLVNFIFATIEGSSFLQQIILVLGLLIVSEVEYLSAISIFPFDG